MIKMWLTRGQRRLESYQHLLKRVTTSYPENVSQAAKIRMKKGYPMLRKQNLVSV